MFYPGLQDDEEDQFDSEENKKRYEAEQKARAYERKIRELKRRIEALKEDSSEESKSMQKRLKSKLNEYADEYRVYCNEHGLKPNNLGVYNKSMYTVNSQYKAKSLFNKNEPLNENATYEISIEGVSDEVNAKITQISAKIVPDGHKYNKEYAYAIDRITGKQLAYEEGEIGECMSKEFFNQIGKRPDDSVLLIHNHTDNKGASMMDVNTFMTDKSIFASIMACNNGDMHYMSGKTEILQAYLMFSCMSEKEKDVLLKDLPNYNKICENTDRKQAMQEELWALEFIRRYVKRYQ